MDESRKGAATTSQDNERQTNRSRTTTIELSNPSPTEIELTIHCENLEQLQAYATWLKHEIEGFKTVVKQLGKQDVTVEYDRSFEGMRAA
jgi:hypothetical protein